MAGGIDLHSHIGGGKTNLSRLLLPEDHRADRAMPQRELRRQLSAPAVVRRLHARHARHRLPLRGDGLHGRLRAGDDAVQRAPHAPGNGRHADHRSRRLRDARQRRTPAADARRPRRLRAPARLRRLDDQREQGARREGGESRRHLGVQVQPALARRRRSARPLRHHAARRAAHAVARADRTARAASAARSREQPRRTRQHRLDDRDDGRRRRPADPPHAYPVPQLRHRRPAQVFVGRARDRRSGERAAERLDRRRPDHLRADRDRFRRHDDAVQERAARQSAQVDRRRYRMRCGLRHRAVPLSRAKLRERAAMDHRAGDFPAGRRSVARLDDDRSSERRPVHELSAPDPPADGQDLPRRATRETAIPKRRSRARCRNSTANSRCTRSRSSRAPVPRDCSG